MTTFALKLCFLKTLVGAEAWLFGGGESESSDHPFGGRSNSTWLAWKVDEGEFFVLGNTPSNLDALHRSDTRATWIFAMRTGRHSKCVAASAHSRATRATSIIHFKNRYETHIGAARRQDKNDLASIRETSVDASMRQDTNDQNSIEP